MLIGIKGVYDECSRRDKLPFRKVRVDLTHSSSRSQALICGQAFHYPAGFTFSGTFGLAAESDADKETLGPYNYNFGQPALL